MSLPDENRERDARALGDIVRAATEESEARRRTSMPARRSDLAARQRLVGAIGGGAPRRGIDLRGRRTWAFGVALAAVLACAALFVLRDRRLDYTVDGGDAGVDTSGYVRAGAHTTAVRFEEGTTFSFVPGSSGRVADVTASGASIVVEDGTVEAAVVHRSGGKWSAFAGPWEVRVTGTRFDVTWDPSTRDLRVDLLDGKVVVRGPGAEDGIGLTAGQTLRAREGDGIHVSAIGRPVSSSDPASSARPAGPPSAPSAVAEAPSDTTDPQREPTAEPPSTTSGPAASSAEAPSASAATAPDKPRMSWTTLVGKGKHDVVLAEARERGVGSVLGSGSAADLLALADAARYGGDGALASRALRALRDRFGGTKAATDAAFLLGRMADDGGSPGAAIRWYDAHVAEGGAFAAEALGRKMIAVKRSSGDGAARAVAEQYLAHYPKGPHAAVARAILGGDVASPQPAPR